MQQLTGALYLLRRNEAVRHRPRLPADAEVLIIEGSPQGPGVLSAVLHLMLGYEARIKQASSFGTALDRLVERKPDLIFLADQVPPSTAAIDGLPILRRCGYLGPMIVIASQPDKWHERALIEAGAADVLERDQIDTVRLSEALARAFLSPQMAAE